MTIEITTSLVPRADTSRGSGVTGETGALLADSEDPHAIHIAEEALRDATRLPDGEAIKRLELALNAIDPSSSRFADDIRSLLETLVLRLAGAQRHDEALARYRELAKVVVDPVELAPVQSSLVSALMAANHPGAVEVALMYVANPTCSCHTLIRIFVWSIAGNDRGNLVRRIATSAFRPCINDPVVFLLYRLGLFQAAHLGQDQAEALLAILDPTPLDPWTEAKAVCHLLRARAYEVQGRMDRTIEETLAATCCIPNDLSAALLHIAALTRANRLEDRDAWCRACGARLPDGHPVRVVAELIAAPGIESTAGVVSEIERAGGLPAGAGRDLVLGVLESTLFPRFADRPSDLEAKGLLTERLEDVIGPVAWSSPIYTAKSLAQMQSSSAGTFEASQDLSFSDVLPLPVLAATAAIAAGDPSALADALEGAGSIGGVDEEIVAFFSAALSILRRFQGDEIGVSPLVVPERLLVPFPWLSGIGQVLRDLAAWLEGCHEGASFPDLPVNGWAGLVGWLLTVAMSSPDQISAAAERYLGISAEFSVIWAATAWIEMRSSLLPQEIIQKAYAALLADPRPTWQAGVGMHRECRALRLALLSNPGDVRHDMEALPAMPTVEEGGQDLRSRLSVRLFAADRAYLDGRRRLRNGDPAGALDSFQANGTVPAAPFDRLIDHLYAPACAYWSAIALFEMESAEDAEAMLQELGDGPFAPDAAVIGALRALKREDMHQAKYLVEMHGSSSAYDYLRGLIAANALPDREAAATLAILCRQHEPPHHRYAALLWALNGRIHERIGEYGIASGAYCQALRYGLNNPALIRGMLRCDIERLKRGELTELVPGIASIQVIEAGRDVAPDGSVAAALYTELRDWDGDPVLSRLHASALLARGDVEGAELAVADLSPDTASDSPITAFREAAHMHRRIAGTLAAGTPAVRIEAGEAPCMSAADSQGIRFWQTLGAMRWEPGHVVVSIPPAFGQELELLTDPYRGTLRLLTAPALAAAGAWPGGEDPAWGWFGQYLIGRDQDLPSLAACPAILDRGTVIVEYILAYLRAGVVNAKQEEDLVMAASQLASGHTACREALVMLLLHQACFSSSDPSVALDACKRAATLMDVPSESQE